MVNISSLPQYWQSTSLTQGNWVRYIGVDLKIQQDYGNQDLRILAIDIMSGIAVCDTKQGQRLVGVALRELESADQNSSLD